MAKTAQDGPVLVVCSWCGDRLPARRDRTQYVASNHALDLHRLALLADPERTMAGFTVTAAVTV